MEVMKIMYLCYCLFSPLATFLQKDHSRFAFRTHNLILLRGSVACPKRGFPPFPSQCYVATPGNGGGGFVSRLRLQVAFGSRGNQSPPAPGRLRLPR
jgi:hypothetical protein